MSLRPVFDFEMKINRLINHVYFNPKEYPVINWAKMPEDFFVIHNPFSIFFLAYRKQVPPFKHEETIIDCDELVHIIIETHLEKIEAQLLTTIFQLLPGQDTGIIARENFNNLSLSDQCVILDLESYPNDRNIMNLVHYYQSLI